ncbi:MAG: hypothetical protein RIS45_185, partial [Planctomycetota bacterium]
LLPWSRDTLTTAQNQKAMEALAKGDRELALFHCENSLRLSHNQPEMIRLREELAGKGSAKQADYEHGMMRRILEKQVKGGNQTAAAGDDNGAADFTDDNSGGSATNSGMNVTPRN